MAVRVWPDMPQIVERANTGDPHDCAQLYGFAAACIKDGRAVPEPVAAFVAERLAALSSRLQGKCGRLDTGIRDAVIPPRASKKPKRRDMPYVKQKFEMIARHYGSLRLQGKSYEEAFDIIKSDPANARMQTSDADIKRAITEYPQCVEDPHGSIA